MKNLPDDIYKPESMSQNGSAILMITDNGVEDLEFFYPYYRFIEAGFKVDVATPKGDTFEGKHGLGLKQTIKVADVQPENYVLLYLPGGKAPAKLKSDAAVIATTQNFFKLGKPIAAICHGPQILAAANIIRGFRISAWPEVEDELRQAGANYVDLESAVDGPFITARWPGDLPLHMKRVLEVARSASKNKGRNVSSSTWAA